MFDRLFRRKITSQVAIQPVGEIFPWPAGTILKPLDRLILALPAALLAHDEVIGSVIHCDDDAEMSIPEGDDKIYISLEAGMEISLTKSVQAIVLHWAEGDADPKRIEIFASKGSSATR